MDTTLDPRRQRLWQARIFTLLWTAYASYYLCRLNFAVAQPAILEAFPDWSAAKVGGIPSFYAAFYAIGQFINGQLADRFGPRRMMTVALSTAVLANLGMAFADSYTAMLVLWSINGYAQSAGWTLVVQTTANWSKVERRGAILGVISTCYAVGNVLAWLLAGFLVDSVGWRAAFSVPALIALPVAIAIAVFLRNDPRDAGLPRIRDDGFDPADEKGAGSRAPIGTLGMLKMTLANPILWVLALGFFCNNSVRYAFMNWTVQYMADFHGRSIKGSAIMAVALPLIGAVGAMSAGWISDTVFGKRRAPVCAISLFLLALLCVAFVYVPMGEWQLATVMLGVAGFLIYGPDMLMSGAATIDFAHPRAAAAATGFTMATGAAGSIFSGAGVGWLKDVTGGDWNLVFYVLAGLSLIPALLMVTIWNARPKGAK
ncbi:MAG: MFS transporter [Pseudomonadota bacterium]